MKQIYILIFIYIFSINTVFAQIPAIQWQKCLGGSLGEGTYPYIQQTTDGGYILGATTSSNNGDVSGNHGAYDFWVVKLDNSGNIQWQKCLGGTSNEAIYSIQQTTDGGYITAGSAVSNNGDVSGKHSLAVDVWVVKLNNTGVIQWQKCLGGTSNDVAHSIQQTTDGGYIVTGYTDSNDGDVSGNHGGRDVWLVKLDNSGNIQWQKCLGGTLNEGGYSVRQTTDGGFILGGTSSSSNGDVSSNNGLSDYWIVKLDNSGNIQWQKSFGGTNGESVLSAQQNSDGSYIIAGLSLSFNGDITDNHGSYDAWILKLDNSGNLQWKKSYGGSNDDQGRYIRQTSNGNYIFTGTTRSNDGDVSGNHGDQDVWVVKLDNNGNLLSQKCIGGTNFEGTNSIELTNDGGFIIAAMTHSNDGDVSGNHGDADDWVAKFGSLMLPVELTQFALHLNTNKTVVSLNWQTASETNNAYFIVQRSQDAIHWDSLLLVAGAGNSSKPQTYQAQDTQALRGTSYYRLKQVDFDGTFTYSIIKVVHINVTNVENIYPNPTSNNWVVKFNNETSIEQLQLYNTNGQYIKSIRVDGRTQVEINATDLVDGIYHLCTDDLQLLEKLVKR